jgi:hypothetical protein
MDGRVREGAAEAETGAEAGADDESAGADGAWAGPLADSLGLGLGLACPEGRPGRGRPSPACRPARDSEGLGLAVAAGSGAPSDSRAYAEGPTDNRSDATVITHRVRNLGVTG